MSDIAPFEKYWYLSYPILIITFYIMWNIALLYENIMGLIVFIGMTLMLIVIWIFGLSMGKHGNSSCLLCGSDNMFLTRRVKWEYHEIEGRIDRRFYENENIFHCHFCHKNCPPEENKDE